MAATYVDPFKSGHRFQFDVVLLRDGGARLLERYRLWLPQIGSLHFVPDRGEGPCIEIGAQGLIETDRPPFGKAWKMLGIARGQATLQHLIYGGTPFAASNDRWLDY
ncbi:conserved hypothetical protein [Sphingomonas sp. EC-HK361]|uniref:hypothetical protein n=1 Tax=Sphingomonas sp. EC-HK361 TaxID=2038397 RepID=UPI0012592A16|nr:hypothetical protein [Sphingomonas sp. EC-HK361]VVT21887.1 conserved hypothetical protein [Sphingomonas sp. EC-HK361]